MGNTYRLFDLQSKEVVNISDGRNIGRVGDVEFSWLSGTIVNLIVPGKPRFFGFWGSGEEILIPWHQIKLIGVDSVLIDAPELEACSPKKIKGSAWRGLFE